MRLVREIRELQHQYANILVLTGNGKTEARILSALCQKYNGKAEFLWFPEVPIRRGLKETGFKPLHAIRVYLTKYKLKRFLFLVDREHLKRVKRKRRRKQKEQEAVNARLKKELKAKIETTCEYLPGKAFTTKAYLGNHPFEVCTVILGITAKVEEEISELIRLKFQIQVDPDKAEIDRFLKKRGKRLEDIIEETSKGYLEKAFPGLCSALKKMEEELGQ